MMVGNVALVWVVRMDRMVLAWLGIPSRWGMIACASVGGMGWCCSDHTVPELVACRSGLECPFQGRWR